MQIYLQKLFEDVSYSYRFEAEEELIIGRRRLVSVSCFTCIYKNLHFI